MKTKRFFLTGVVILALIGHAVNESYAHPVAVISGCATGKEVCVDSTISFKGNTSYDTDEGGSSIVDYEWSWPAEAYGESGQGTDTFTCKFSPVSSASGYTVKLRVKDDENVWSTWKSCTVYVVEVVSVTPDKTIVHLGCDDDITFTVTTNPSGHCGPVTWSGGGPWSSTSPDNCQFTTHWDDPGVKTVTATCGSSSDSKQVKVIGVSSFTWETYGDNLAVSGGKIFPGKKTYNDSSAANRKKVWIKATVVPSSVASGKTVYFSWWDIDDPSSDPTIDTNGSVGGDNLGSGESLSASSATTNASGEAKVVFTVSMQPGDNFKIAASTCSARLNETTQTMVDNDNLPRSVKLSPTLTTWRKLHLERDSMVTVATSGPEDNWVRGGIDTGSVDYDPVADETEVALHQDLADCWEETKQFHFEGGTFHAGMDYSALRTISHAGDDEIVVDGNVWIGWPMSYWLKDDDHTNLLPDLLDMGKLNSIFDDCYITCDDNASGGAQNVAFERNVGGAWTDASEVKDVADIGSAAEEDDAWWVVYILSAYQPGYSEDNDPASESCTWGFTEGIDFQVSIILLESSDDVANEKGVSSATLEQQTVVHEIGWQVLESLTYTPNTIMAPPGSLPVDPQYEKFSPADIATIRGQVSSPGI